LDYLMGIGPQGGYNSSPGTFNSSGPFGAGGQYATGGSGSNPATGQQSPVYGINGTTPNYGVQGGTPAPTQTGGQNPPNTISDPRMPRQQFSIGGVDLLNPFSGGSSNPLNPINALTPPGLPNVYSFNGATVPGAATSALNELGNVGSSSSTQSPTITAAQTAAGGSGYGGAPGSYTPSQSAAGGYGSLNAPFTADMMKQYSPAYQFQLQQGGQGVLNTDSANVGAESGAAFKDLMGYNQNLANTSFNNAFNQYQTQQGNTYNRLMGTATLGQNAASNLGAQGTQLAGNAASLAASQGAALAGGTIGSANAISGAANSAATIPWLMAYQQKQSG